MNLTTMPKRNVLLAPYPNVNSQSRAVKVDGLKETRAVGRR